MRATFARLPQALTQIAVFDTAFHQTMKPEAYLYALPRKYYRDLRRPPLRRPRHLAPLTSPTKTARILGFDPNDNGIVVCHLGNGSSVTAVWNGKCVDTSMGLTPLEGLVMGTRSGDVDYGALAYIANKTGLDVNGLEKMVNRESGLLGLSELSNDCRTLTEAAQAGNRAGRGDARRLRPSASCRYIGAFTAA